MLILLPPSEGKSAPASGPRLDMSTLLGADKLSPARRRAMEALREVSSSPQAASFLGLGPRSAADASLNLSLESSACAPAHDLFSGVLYEAARLSSLARQDAAGRAVGEHAVILSGLWGAVRATDLLPDHRLSMGRALPGLGRMSAYWKAPLAPVLDDLAAGRTVVDCRSAAYAAAWQPLASLGTTLLRVKAVAIDDQGGRAVISHQAKHTRGLLTAALLGAVAGGALGPECQAEDVAQIAAGIDGVEDVELGRADRRGRRDLTVLTRPGA